MGLWDFLGDLARRPTRRVTSFRIPDENVDETSGPIVTLINTDEHYLQLG